MPTPFLSRLLRAGLRPLVALSLAGAAGVALAVTPGEAAPEVQLQGPGGPVQLAALRGKLVYLDFWASWCGPCKQSFPWMNEMQAKYGPQGLQVVAVSVDARPADAEKFLAEVPAHFTIAFDPKGQSPKTYAIKGMPTSVLIGPDGKVIQVHSGFRADERAALEQAIVQALPKR
ncbi:TlpA family protein disulfide reductase [Ideonella livida]|uniref:TlpA family protein disulfide reductase n=1 Tax=Ideonella livida TaxID=2707176 RepID=A0A7C9PJF9_9BURK|nr:TlpA disulfide reductase family protein [Ideonella livida]NDY93495.1 TlpA family protein disulfide reductase [Ideonella livida]